MATLEVLFQPVDGSPIAKVFKHKPLGLFYKIEAPIIVSLVMGEAENIGVQAGWRVVRVGDTNLVGLPFEESCRALWDGAKDLPESVISCEYPPDTASIANMNLWWTPPAPCQAVCILHSFGYSAFGPNEWKDVKQPHISLQLARKHAVAACDGDGPHTWYDIHGRLSSDSCTQDWLWIVPRRQIHLKKLLHDPVRLELGEAYGQHFKSELFMVSRQAPTAPMVGTWLANLARVINACQLSPALTAVVLGFLETPQIIETSWNEALVRGREHGRPQPTHCVPKLMQQPDQSSLDACLLLDDLDDDEMPTHPPICSQDGSNLKLGHLRQVFHFGGHNVVRELI
mmetsp:Transcript_118722/g.236475  ORF Transcript_118722/g.236475 Transcript_118722/m.236475 type:complete len:342 (+) Transcript_118722:146-1171(+)